MVERRNVMVPRTIALGVGWALSFAGVAVAHIIPPESLHPLAEAYRRCTFVLNLNPVRWELVRHDAETIEHWLRKVDPDAADRFDAEYGEVLGGEELSTAEWDGRVKGRDEFKAKARLSLLNDGIVKRGKRGRNWVWCKADREAEEVPF